MPPPVTMEHTTTTNGNGNGSKDFLNNEPGAGWSNGDIRPQMHTQEGRLALYSKERRWIGLRDGWTRIGDGHEHDDRHSSSGHTGDHLVENESDQGITVRSLIAQLCENFYKHGWATGTGGGCSIRVRHPQTHDWRVFVAPSGIQKEDMIGDDIFELDMDRNVIHPPKTAGLRQSACTPLWYIVYRYRPTVQCVIHTHSMNAVFATLLDPTENSDCLDITHLEMLKGVGHHAYDDILKIPIIDNRPSEDLLAAQLESVMEKYPLCNAVLVRRHGIYCWGDSWEQAKTQCESFDYLFECAIQMKKLGVDSGVIPKSGTYRTDDRNKKRRLESNFNGVGNLDNTADCTSNTVPLLPRDHKILLLDVEGCTTSIAFVKDVLFPFARQHMNSYCQSLEASDYKTLKEGLQKDVLKHSIQTDAYTAEGLALALMDKDVKSASLKSLQGVMWQKGYESGELQGHVYSDVVPALDFLIEQKVQIYIYSSGSVAAQKLLFGNTKYGDLCPKLSGHFDITTAGPKKDSNSYLNIAKSLNVDISQIVFASDAMGELEAAHHAGLEGAVMSIRPGNAPLTINERHQFPTVHSLLQLCGAE